MQSQQRGGLELTGSVLVCLMATLQLAYAIYAYLDPASFAVTRGTELFSLGDADWVQVYASRTLFIAFLIGYLFYLKQFKILAFAALAGVVMPVTDAFLAYQANALDKIVLKHVATAVFLLVTFLVLQATVKNGQKG
jgi:hypothetical protein